MAPVLIAMADSMAAMPPIHLRALSRGGHRLDTREEFDDSQAEDVSAQKLGHRVTVLSAC
jgi:hypothetical protein